MYNFFLGMSAEDISALQALVKIAIGEFIVLELLAIVVLMYVLARGKRNG